MLDAAALLADRDGLAALNLTALAEHLKVRPPSLYKHLEGLDAIYRGLALRGLTEANERLQRATIGKSRDEALFALAHAYWQFARERPGLYAASLRPVESGDKDIAIAGETLIGTLTSVLSGYGIKGDDMRHAVRGLRAIIHGFVSLDAARAFRLRGDLNETFERIIRGFSRSLSG